MSSSSQIKLSDAIFFTNEFPIFDIKFSVSRPEILYIVDSFGYLSILQVLSEVKVLNRVRLLPEAIKTIDVSADDSIFLKSAFLRLC